MSPKKEVKKRGQKCSIAYYEKHGGWHYWTGVRFCKKHPEHAKVYENDTIAQAIIDGGLATDGGKPLTGIPDNLQIVPAPNTK